MACTTFFPVDTSDIGTSDAGADASGGDASATGGACCTSETCREVSESTCADFGGEFTAGAACDDVRCGPDCETYCEVFNDTCSVVADDYVSKRVCLQFCENGARWPSGAEGDQGGNTIGCRIYHAETAAGPSANRAFHCQHAGITGDRICGGLCENYCRLMEQICTGDNAQYDDFEACTERCQGGVIAPGIPDDGSPGDTSGNTIQCRIYHVSAAFFTANPAVHCPHASLRSSPDTCGLVGLP